MGFFDALKSVTNMVTGGGATLSLVIGARSPNGSYPAEIKAEIADGDLKVEKVYLSVEGYETVKIKMKKDGQTDAREENFHETTFKTEINVVPAQTFPKKTSHKWEATITLPPDVQPTYTGKNATHEWRAYAGLSVTGTDPASSWVVFKV